MPVEIMYADPSQHDEWTQATAAAVERVLSA
jgi:hypothetical protein